MDYSERWMRAEIAAIPDGVLPLRGPRWRTTGSSSQPITFRVTVTVDGDRLIVDWNGTDPQVRGPVNATYGVTAGAVYNAIFHLTDAQHPEELR